MPEKKYMVVSREKLEEKLFAGKIFTKSEMPMLRIIHEFNKLSGITCTQIKQEWKRRETIIQEKMKRYLNNEDLYITLIGIEFHKVAAMFDTQPDVVILCIEQSHEKKNIIIK